MSEPAFWNLGLVGSPISHSRSPIIHGAALKASGLSGEYLLYERDTDGLDELLDTLRGGVIHGLNVTIPHKETLLRHCDELDPLAELVGAVNTLVVRDGRIVGFNTDVQGLETALLSQWPSSPWRSKRCTVYGAGGAARAACVALRNIGAGEIVITNRTRKRAQELARLMSQRLDIRCTASNTHDAFRDSSLVIQATSLGVNNREQENVAQRAKELMVLTDPACLLMDLVYSPALPPFAVGARAAERQAVGGLGMLVYQAQRAFQLWTGKVVTTSLLEEVVLATT